MKTMKRFAARICALFVVLTVSLTALVPAAFAATKAQLPDLPSSQCVVDDANILSSSTKTAIENLNAQLTQQCEGAQIGVLTVDYTGSLSTEDYAVQAANTWGLGSSSKNNGVLILLVMQSQQYADGDYYLATGDGFRNTMLEKQASAIAQTMEDSFAAGDYDAAVTTCANNVASTIADLYGVTLSGTTGTVSNGNTDGYNNGNDYYEAPAASYQSPFLTLLAVVIVVFALTSIFGGIRRGFGGGGFGPFFGFGLGYGLGSRRRRRPPYDDWGPGGPRGPRGPRPPRGGGPRPPRGGGGFGGGFGGSSRNPNAPSRGRDIQASVTLTFEEAAKGCKKTIEVMRVMDCSECGGTGAAKGTTPTVCPECHGSGVQTVSQRTPLGVMSTQRTCSRCGGTGKIINTPCQKCNGKGKVRTRKKIEVNIPAGIDNNQIVNVRGFGNAGSNGGPSGDLKVIISIKKHAYFKRDGYDVWFDKHISIVEATLGAEVEIPTLEGNVKLNIPAGTQPGGVFTLKGNKGISRLNGMGKGDEHVRIIVDIPKNVTSEQKQLLKEFDKTYVPPKNSGKEGFFDKFKKK